MLRSLVFIAFLFQSCVIAIYESGTQGIVVDLEYLPDGYYTAQVNIGSNNQPLGDDAPHGYFLLDLQTNGLYVASSEIKNFDGIGVYNSTDSTTYVQISTEE